MRRTATLSAALCGLALSSTAVAGAPPRLVTHDIQSAPSLVGIKGERAADATLDQAARSVIVETSSARMSPLSLGASEVVSLPNGERVVKMRQMHKGVPVLLGGASVVFGKDDAAQRVLAKLIDDLPDDVTPAVSAAFAAEQAKKLTRLEADDTRAKLAIWTVGDESFLAWVVKPAAIPGFPFEPVLIFDAKTGELSQRFNAAVEAMGNVYPTNPTKSPNLIQADLSLEVGATILKNARVESLNCVDKKTTKTINVGFPIQVHVCELEQSATPDGNGDFLLPAAGDTEPEDPFSQVQMFYHTNRAYNTFLGFDPAFDVNPGDPASLPVIANLRLPDFNDFANIGNPNSPLVPFQNAFFSPGDQLFGQVFGTPGPAMYFGQGPVHDYAYDGDVVYHEFGHGVINATLQLVPTPHLDKYGVSVSNGGMNEGLADYFSAAIGGDPDIGEYAAKDFSASLSFIRSLANPDMCPTEIGGEVHQDATLFAGGLWDARVKLAEADAKAFDLAIYNALAKLPPPSDLGFEELAQEFVASVEASLGKPVADSLTAAFTARGVLPMCARVLEHPGGTINGPKDLQNLWFALGTQTIGSQVKGYAPGVVQAHHALPERTNSMTVSIERVNISTGGGLGGPMGTPFTPKLLVKFAADPITFSDFTPITPEGETQLVEMAEDNDTFSATVPVDESATDVHFMIVNEGQLDGAFTQMKLSTVQSPDPTGTGGAGGMGGMGGSASGTGGGSLDPSDDGGCGCSVPGAEDGPSAALVLAAAGLAASLVRRRRGRLS
ncbi:MAG: MYXO-CTERM sorting domain-containing protein [Polyangiaceae bacterium]|nr:MYXO-CTERM sorting domain-containing protein [Polyangiaceae bacterium]